MADFELPCYDDDHSNMLHRNDSVTDLHAYYMSQFNLELENSSKTKSKPATDSFKYGLEESFDFEALDSWNTSVDKSSSVTTDYEVIDGIISKNINEQSIKEVLLDLDSIDFESTEIFANQNKDSQVTPNYHKSNEYIDDESLIDELCREDGETPRLSPDAFDHGYGQAKEVNTLPPIETAFSKRYYNYSTNDMQQSIEPDKPIQTTPAINSIEYFSYPNNILYNLDNNKKYPLPDTPTSCTEFNFDRNERKVSVCESIESDVQSSCYYDENSENLDEDELFVNLDEFGIHFEEDGVNITESHTNVNKVQKAVKEKSQGEKACLWEHCFEKYPNQNTLVEHIERMHVNTYKGDEFSCLWKDCARARRPFNARYKLLIHMRVHSGHKPNRCHHPGCGKAFSRLENLKIHVRSHTGERPYACPAPHCRKAFSNSSDRAKHQRTHFNARPYACGAAGCGKRYTDPSSLRKHVKSHPHIPNVPRTCIPPSRVMRRPDHEQLVPSSPAKLTTMRCIRDKLTVPRLHRI